MKQKNVNELRWAIGYIDGLGWIADDRLSQALEVVSSTLSNVLEDEEKPDEEI